MIYLDNNATTCPAPQALEAAQPFLAEWWGNPSSAYDFAQGAAHALLRARERTATALHCDPVEVVFTSGGSESIATAINSALYAMPQRKRIVTTAVEHAVSLDGCRFMTDRGYEVVVVGVDRHGRLELEQLSAAIDANTALVNVMWANNEIGNLYPVAEISQRAKARGALVHVDAVQAVGKVPVDWAAMHAVDYLSLSAHKFHGLKGAGALLVRRGSRFTPLVAGGHQERGRRAGTENVAGIVALGAALECATKDLVADAQRIARLRDHLQAVVSRITDVMVNGDPMARVPNTLSMSFRGADAEPLLILLDQMGICASAGAACATGSLEPSHVIRAMGVDPDYARGTLRLSLSRMTTQAEVEQAASAIAAAVAQVRAL